MGAIGFAVGMIVELLTLVLLVLLVLPCAGQVRWSRGYGDDVSGWSVRLLRGAVTGRRVTFRGRTRRSWSVLGRRVLCRRDGPGRGEPGPIDDAAPARARRKRRLSRLSAPIMQHWLSQPDLLLRWVVVGSDGLRQLAGTVKLEPITLRTCIGLGDPAATGMAYGLLWGLLGSVLGGLPCRAIAIDADWFHATCAVDVRLGVRGRPSDVMIALMRLALRAPWLATWRSVRSQRGISGCVRSHGRAAEATRG